MFDSTIIAQAHEISFYVQLWLTDYDQEDLPISIALQKYSDIAAGRHVYDYIARKHEIARKSLIHVGCLDADL